MIAEAITNLGGENLLCPLPIATISKLPRPALSLLVERLIDLLDDMDGDPDLEDDDHAEDDDPAGDPLDLYGEAQSDNGDPLYPAKPLYGSDQSKGPINEVDAHRALMSAEFLRSAQ